MLVRDDRAHGVEPRGAVAAHGGEERQPHAELAEESAAHPGQVGAAVEKSFQATMVRAV